MALADRHTDHCARGLTGSVKAEAEAKAGAEVARQDENMSQTEPAAAGSSKAVAATPSFLAPDALRALVACGMVGTVTCVLSP
jgi:hypothetical protein